VFSFYYLEKAIDEISNPKLSLQELNDLYELFCEGINAAENVIISQSDLLFNQQVFQQKCELFHAHLEHRFHEIGREMSKKFFLTKITITQIRPSSYRIPSPCRLVSQGNKQSDNERFLLYRSESNLLQLLEWANVIKDAKHLNGWYVTAQVILHTIEREVFALFLQLEANNHHRMSGEVVTSIEGLLELYQKVLRKFMKSNECQFRMITNLKSHEILVCFCGLCVVFSISKMEYPLLAEYGIAFTPEDLPYFVLRGKYELHVLTKLTEYLAKQKTTKPIFHPNSQNHTFELAEIFGERYLSQISKQVKKEQESKVTARWSGIKHQRSELQEKRKILAKKKKELAKAQGTKHQLLIIEMRNVEKEIETLSKVPKLIQGLPQESGQAFRWLFFLHLPEHLRIAAALTLLCKILLIPAAARKTCVMAADVSHTDITQHYQQHHNPPSIRDIGPLLIVTKGKLDEQTVSLSSIQAKGEGVFSPDEWELEFLFKLRTSGETINPFQAEVGENQVAEEFTEKLKETKSLQWCLVQQSICPSHRGNLGLSTQDQRPEWMSKSQYLHFTSLRAFPQIQLRKLLICLQERSLPFGREEVQTIIKQLIYQVGPVDAVGQFLWRQDLPLGIYEYLNLEVKRLVQDLGQRPRDSSIFLLLAEVAAYLSQFDLGDEVVDLIVDTLEGWVANIEITLSAQLDPTRLQSWKHRQCLFQLYALIALGGQQPLSKKQLGGLCRIVFRVRSALEVEKETKHESLAGEGEMGIEEFLQEVEEIEAADAAEPNSRQSTADDQKTKRILGFAFFTLVERREELIKFVKRYPARLTQSLQLILPKIPNQLTWEQLHDGQMCFEATDNDGNVYSANVLTGVLLMNGVPPRTLPLEILNHKMYQRTFGEISFEIVKGVDGWMETVRMIHGKYYRFHLPLNSDSQFIIEEKSSPHEGDRQSLKLIPEGWNKSLPTRLQEMYNHWYHKELDTIIYRPFHVKTKTVEFILRQASGPVPVLFQIPKHCQSDEQQIWRDVSEDKHWNRLTQPNPGVLQVLTKFERADCIHFFATPDKTTRVEMPRYGLSFEYREGVYESLDYPEMRLSECQQLPDTLLRFQQYLILERTTGHYEKKILVPEGKITVSEGRVEVERSEACEAQCMYYPFDIHQRLGLLESSNVEGRLYLAALYSANSMGVPDPRCGMVGDEYAMILLRQSEVRRPLSPKETKNLENCFQLALATPALRLLCQRLKLLSRQLGPLYKIHHQENMSQNSAPLDHTSISYMDPMRQTPTRQMLTTQEEISLFGFQTCARRAVWNQAIGYIQIEVCPISSHYPSHIETKLSSQCPREISQQSNAPQFPLASERGNSTLESTYLSDLQQSWSAYWEWQRSNGGSEGKIKMIGESAIEALLEVKMKREQVEGFIFHSINNIPQELIDPQVRVFCLRRSKFQIPRLTLRDLLIIAQLPSTMQQFNPFLTTNSVEEIMRSIILWMELCVLEDKLMRIEILLREFPAEMIKTDLLREVATVRTWNSRDHISWLVFEVEGRLQIRPQQHTAVMSMIQNPGMIGQINMGEGKTRVMLPMLCLYFSKLKTCAIRIVMLSSILQEGYEYLHRYLCASALNMKVYVLPFHRGIHMTKEISEMLLEICQSNVLEDCVTIMSPESILSLQLKMDEIKLAKDPEKLLEVLNKVEDLKWCDLLDESDELLSQRYRLIYSVGSQIDLPSGSIRWECIFALLHELSHSEIIKKELEKIAIYSQGLEKVGEFHPFYLSVEGGEDSWRKIVRQLAEGIVAQFVSLGMVAWDRRDCGRIVEYITDATDQGLDIPKDETVFALRGYLAQGTLKSCLQSRHRVQYGIHRHHPRGIRMAVPFRANNIPEERSEFKHPDAALFYTCLSYYSEGISKAELQMAFRMLLELGPNEQTFYYNEWSRHPSREVLPQSINQTHKIDISNEEQLELLHQYFHLNMGTINFWLKRILFPLETRQHDHTIQRTTWHLCNSLESEVRGFSGTKDKKLLLPLHVNQQPVEHMDNLELKSASGKMMALMLRNDNFHCLEGDTSWKALLQKAMKLRVEVLIDTGALLVGIENAQAADYVLKILGQQPELKGVVYFDPSAKSWMVKSRNEQVWPLSSSPIRPTDCFTIFDESRCRGADLSFKSTAKGLVTLGPRMTNDKLMQGLGRMRRLDQCQRVVYLGHQDVTRQICRVTNQTTSAITSLMILRWVIANTIDLVRDGLAEWTNQGVHYCLANRETSCLLMKEYGACQEFYSDCHHSIALPEYYQKKVQELQSQFQGVEIPQSKRKIAKAIQVKLQSFVDITISSTSNYVEECEKELEITKEIEGMREPETVAGQAVAEIDWNPEIVRRLNSSAYQLTGFIPLREVVRSHVKLTEHGIAWPDNIYCSQNFLKTVLVERESNQLSALRPIDSVLCINSDFVLISEREAQRLMPTMRKVCRSQNVVRMVNHALMRSSQGNTFQDIPLALCIGDSATHERIDDLVVLALQIFHGEPMYGHRKHRLGELFLDFGAGKLCAKELVERRGNGHLFEKSELDLCDHHRGNDDPVPPAVCPPPPAHLQVSSNKRKGRGTSNLRPMKRIFIDLVDED
jgi:hypothetical protein